ncbi:BA75_01696T0 [Komagataella pastoris]|uniref:BA75_01696T0 n=1 Tax=Komagataella pastoris TaxID=4922 RepID=A0A1B2J713_PICPA|nr:BA75_01696T0 [Komagataella pastoris]
MIDISPFLMVFTGCCGNVFSLETLVTKTTYSVGTMVTFCQFLYVALVSYLFVMIPGDGANKTDEVLLAGPKKDWYSAWLPESKVPMKRYYVNIFLFFVTNVLNNYVFVFNIGIPIHVVFRSSSVTVTMLIGYCFLGKTYNVKQICGSVLLSIGVVITMIDNQIAQNEAKGVEYTGNFIDWSTIDLHYMFGIFVMTLANVLTCVMALYTETTYKKYGKSTWMVNLFYQHAFALPLFLFVSLNLKREFEHFTSNHGSLLINCLTQFLCVAGVNKTASLYNAVTLSIILMIRKLVSLLISCYFFDNSFNAMGYFGIFMVVVGTALYTVGGRSAPPPAVAKSEKLDLESKGNNQD